jgi:hypothetical protein
MGHHYVPQQYLRAFQTLSGDDEIWTYDKRDRKSRVLPIKVVAQSPKFYDEDVERELGKMEATANKYLKEILSTGSLPESGRQALAYYVAVMMYRSPRSRRKNFERVPEVRDKVLAAARDAVENWAAQKPANDPMVARRRKELSEAEIRLTEEPPKSVTDQIRSPWPSAQVFDLVMRKTWRLLLSDGLESFITSDGPAVFFEGLGLGNKDSELTISLSPTVALVADHKGEEGTTKVFNVRKQMVREVNRRIVAHAERFIFASTEQAWVPRVAHKARPYLSRIVWAT